MYNTIHSIKLEFFVKEEIPTAEIHRRHAYGDECMGASSVRRWVKTFKDGHMCIQNQPRSGRFRTASTQCSKS